MTTVSVVLPVMLPTDAHLYMARACIEIMRCTTRTPFELVVVETGSELLKGLADCHIHKQYKTCYSVDFNRGVDESSGELIVHTGSDVFMGEGWLEAMLDIFETMPDAGAAGVAVSEPAGFIGPQQPHASIVESFFGALFMFPRKYRLDAGNFPDTMSDHDLCLQIYADGKRAYRNNAVVCRHLKQVTFDGSEAQEELDKRFHAGVTEFNRKWAAAPWLIKHLIIRGGVQYGREHEWIGGRA
jgi:hypothetical protein